MRLFFALWPPLEAARALAGWAAPLGGRPVPAQNIHLTLAFLGAAQAAPAAAAARRARGAPHRLPLEQARYWRRSEIVWAGPRATPPALESLVQSLHLELFRAEFILERRPFVAHVTLARKAPPPGMLPALPPIDWPVHEFTLVRSHPHAAGSIYEVLEAFALQ